eukprot:6134163-Ditylum_brightwellii.AAC.1
MFDVKTQKNKKGKVQITWQHQEENCKSKQYQTIHGTSDPIQLYHRNRRQNRRQTEEETDITSAINTLTEQNAPIPTTQVNSATIAPENISSRGSDRIELNINNTFRILTNNVNGFNTINEGGELLDELTIIKELNFSAGCFQETNKNWHQCGVYKKIKAIQQSLVKKQTRNFKQPRENYD